MSHDEQKYEFQEYIAPEQSKYEFNSHCMTKWHLPNTPDMQNSSNFYWLFIYEVTCNSGWIHFLYNYVSFIAKKKDVYVLLLKN